MVWNNISFDQQHLILYFFEEAHNGSKTENNLHENELGSNIIDKSFPNVLINTASLPPIVEQKEIKESTVNTIQPLLPVEDNITTPQINIPTTPPSPPPSSPATNPIFQDQTTSSLKVSNLRKLYGIGARYEQILNEKWGIYDIIELRDIPDSLADKIKSEIPPIKKFKQRAATYDQSFTKKKK